MEATSVARTWLSIQVDLVEGHGQHVWPRPGRIFAAARNHTFAQLADAIDDAFARWDRAHLHEFTLADGVRLTTPHVDWEELGPAIDDHTERLSNRTIPRSRTSHRCEGIGARPAADTCRGFDD
jgi:hypothetical protein